ncbi:MAG TPA: H-X9-DG-CTERM domain-containing protein, partial [Chthonomonadaceae bacterium]|nr:H-X9-DG-CTERM domain-containing protein [Chthonomonadaceae bacterium]
MPSTQKSPVVRVAKVFGFALLVLTVLLLSGIWNPFLSMNGESEDRFHGLVHIILDAITFLFLPALAYVLFYGIGRSALSNRYPSSQRMLNGFLWPALFVILLGVAGTVADAFLSAELVRRQNICLTNVKTLSLGLLMYSEDWEESFPPAAHWGDATVSYLTGSNTRHDKKSSSPNALQLPQLTPSQAQNEFHCPSETSPFGYASNGALDKLSIEKMEAPSYTVMLFESNAMTFNASGGRESLVSRHGGTANVSFADGHVHWANAYVRSHLQWNPF